MPVASDIEKGGVGLSFSCVSARWLGFFPPLPSMFAYQVKTDILICVWYMFCQCSSMGFIFLDVPSIIRFALFNLQKIKTCILSSGLVCFGVFWHVC
jgi:hypothetical protein